MKIALVVLCLSIGGAAFGTEILSEHAGRFRCQCLHEGCKATRIPNVDLLVDHAHDRLAILYGDETQSGAPARITYPDGSVTYTLASRGTVSFSAGGAMKFGWGKLWTCQRLP